MSGRRQQQQHSSMKSRRRGGDDDDEGSSFGEPASKQVQRPMIDDDSDEEEVIDEAEFAEFICDDDDGDGESGSSPIVHRKRRKRHHKRLELDQEDLDLIRENAQNNTSASAKRGRLVVIEDSDEEVHGGHESDDVEGVDEITVDAQESVLADMAKQPISSQCLLKKVSESFDWSYRTDYHSLHEDFGEDDKMFCLAMERSWRTTDFYRSRNFSVPVIERVDAQIRLLKIRDGDRMERSDGEPSTTPPVDENELSLETNWMLFKNRTNKRWMADQSIRDKIASVISFIRNEHLEVLFIKHYRKEHIQPTLTTNDLWRIYDLDQEWSQLRGQIASVSDRLQRIMSSYGETISKSLNLTDCVSLLNMNSPDNEILDDVKALISVYFREDNCLRQGINGVVEALRPIIDHIGINPNKLADQIESRTYKTCEFVEPKNSQQSPRDVARTVFFKKQPQSRGDADDGFSAINAAASVTATGLISHPRVRRAIRRLFIEESLIDAAPCNKCSSSDNSVVGPICENDDPIRNYASKAVFMRNKRLRDLRDDECFFLNQAFKSGLLTFKHYLPEHFKQAIKKSVLSTSSDDRAAVVDSAITTHNHVDDWKDLRAYVLDLMLSPDKTESIRLDVFEKKLEQGKQYVIDFCRDSFYERIRYRLDDCLQTRNLCFVTYKFERGPWNKPGPASLVMLILDQFGIEIDHKFLHFNASFSEITSEVARFLREGRRNRQPSTSARTSASADPRVHAIFIAAEDRHALQLKRDFSHHLKKTFIGALGITDKFANYPDSDLNIAADKQLIENGLLQRALAFGRCVINPLNEYTKLFNNDRKILCVNLEHPLQYAVDQGVLYEALLREVKNQVAIVGVDIHRCCQHAHTSHLLKFVPGIGPQKAQYMLHRIKTSRECNTIDELVSTQIEGRIKLMNICNLGPKVFTNCAGFIKIDRRWLESDRNYDCLDGTRIHPEAYDWACKLCHDAFEGYSAANVSGGSTSLQDDAAYRVMHTPECLKDLDLALFAKVLADSGQGMKKDTLMDIRDELLNSFADRRPSAKLPSPKDEVFATIGEGSETVLLPNSILRAQILAMVCRPPLADAIDNYVAESTMDHQMPGNYYCLLCEQILNKVVCFHSKEDCIRHLNSAANQYNSANSSRCVGVVVGFRVLLRNLARFAIDTTYEGGSLTGYLPSKSLLSPSHIHSDKIKQNAYLRARFPLHKKLLVRVVRFETDSSKITLEPLEMELREPLNIATPNISPYMAPTGFGASSLEQLSRTLQIQQPPQNPPPKAQEIESRKRKSIPQPPERHSKRGKELLRREPNIPAAPGNTKKTKQKQTLAEVPENPAGPKSPSPNSLFRDVSASEAQKILETMPVGSAIIRPSSTQGSKVFVLMLRVTPEVTRLFRVEKDEIFGDHGYILDTQKFTNFEEIESRFIFPLCSLYNEMSMNKCYISHQTLKNAADNDDDQRPSSTNAKIQNDEELLSRCKRYLEQSLQADFPNNAAAKNTAAAAPRHARYLLTMSVSNVGNAIIAYGYMNSLREFAFKYHYVSVRPHGFRFRKQLVDSCSKLIGAVTHLHNRLPTMPPAKSPQPPLPRSPPPPIPPPPSHSPAAELGHRATRFN